MLSFVIPVFNDAEALQALLSSLCQRFPSDAQIIVVDGGSCDESRAIANQFPCELVLSERGRAAQMNAGAAKAQGANFFFLHADTQLPEDIQTQLRAFDSSQSAWGFFPLRIVHSAAAYRIIEWFITRRSSLTSIATGDQLICVRQECFAELGGFASIPLMEDIELSKRLKRVAAPWIAGSPVATSARRWQKNGIFKTVCQMWYLRLAYFFGVSPEKLARLYYKAA